MKEPFKSAIPVLERIEKAGFKAFFVGGSVRDYLLGLPISDIDIASSATPNEIKAIFPRTVDLGIEHGTVMVLHHNHSYEITTFRSESDYEDFRRPSQVTFIRSIEEDLARRDFTMNAVAMNPLGELLDPFGGQKDIELKLIRTVGNANERFSEDALRMLRGIRFVSKLSFTLEKDTYKGIKNNKHLLSHIAVERIASELDKLLSGKDATRGLELLVNTELHKYIPGTIDKEKILITLSQLPIQTLDADEIWGLFSFLLQKSEKEVKQFFNGLRFANKRIQQVTKMCKFLQERSRTDWTREMVYEAGEDMALCVEKIHLVSLGIKDSRISSRLNGLIEALPIHSLADVAVTGTDLIKWKDKKPGPWVKDLLKQIETEVLHGRLKNDNEVIKEWVTRCNLS